ncbi:flagellin [Sporosarcina sp. NCCP-2222]|nr:flagellin [Sporosarcina sp. NCCP-2222]
MASTSQGKSLEKLSSGLSINRASDDAAGLAISEKMRGQIRGLQMAEKNIQDGISLIQTAEGAMTEVHALLQRGRELSVQASNDTNTESDRRAMNDELTQIKEEITLIAGRTEFNGMKLLGGNVRSDAASIAGDAAIKSKQALTSALIGYMLETTEQMVKTAYGIGPAPVRNMTVEYIEEAAGGAVASVNTSGYVGDPSSYTFTMKIDLADFFDDNLWISKDRIIAHEMTHAMMAASGMEWIGGDIPTWFKEGSAEYLAGANERLSGDVAGNGTAGVVTALTGPISTSEFYSASYAATVYLDQVLLKNANTDMKNFMAKLAEGKSFDSVLSELLGSSGIADNNAFLTKFQADGAAFISSTSHFKTGSGSILNPTASDKDTVPDTDNPLNESNFFKYIWDSSTEYAEKVQGINSLVFQIGANSGQAIEMDLPSISTATLGISMAYLMTNPSASISFFDQAIEKVSSQRAYLGSIGNRLEHAQTATSQYHEQISAAESRIRDVDMAKEVMEMTKQNILIQASQAMLAQTNHQPEGVLQLLR